MYWVYVLENSKDKSWYIGFTTNIRKRIIAHNNGAGARTTRIKHGLWKIIYIEGYCNKKDAIGREKFLKGGSGRKYLYKQLLNYLAIKS